MPFKIVQTFENGNIVLTCVPNSWERNGVLFWPRNRKQSHTIKLQKDEGSQPDDTWQRINCAVKRRNIKTYQDAVTEIGQMSNNSETESDIEDVLAKKRRKCFDAPKLSYNIMAEESLQNDKHNTSSITTPGDGQQVIVAHDETTRPIASTSSGTLLNALQENIVNERYLVISESNQSDSPIIYCSANEENSSSAEKCDLKSLKSDIDTIKSDVKSIKDDIKTMIETLNTTLNNQAIIHNTLESLVLQVTKVEVMNEEFIKKSYIEKQNDSLVLKPIKDLKDLEDFEKKLFDSDYKADLQRKLSVLCSKGTGQGTTSAYTIIDLMFERQFFKSCSWTGASRSQNEPTEKICFKSFSKTISFFFDIIHKQDSSFHLTECHNFFKTILRNADQRCKTEPKRASTKKCRGKKSVKKTSENLETNETPPEQPPQFSSSQIEVEDVAREIFV